MSISFLEEGNSERELVKFFVIAIFTLLKKKV